MIRLAVALIVLGSIAVPIAQQSAEAMSLRQLQQKLQTTTRSIRDYQTKLRATKKKQYVAVQELGISENRLGVHRARLSDIRSQLAMTRAQLTQAQAALKLVEVRLKKRNDLLSARLVDTYKHGNVSYMSVLLGSDDFYDLLSRGYVIRKILDTDVELVNSIKEDQQAALRYKARLQQKERERAALESQQTSVTQAALGETRRRQQLLSRIEHDRAAYEQALAEFQSASNSLESRIRSLQRTPAGQKRVANPWKGGYVSPLTASYRISSRFGIRIHPIHRRQSFHTGVDMACPSGSTIRAAAGGTVIIAGWYGVYGNTVVIDHGGRVSTLYGHCSRLRVSVGAKVRQGQTIANVGSTGWSTGPHLHFEKRVNGSPVNPM